MSWRVGGRCEVLVIKGGEGNILMSCVGGCGDDGGEGGKTSLHHVFVDVGRVWS